jgi:TolB-like protein
VVREGDQVRVTVQLLDGPNDRHLWSENYQRPLPEF